jgi:hypothetical protein
VVTLMVGVAPHVMKIKKELFSVALLLPFEAAVATGLLRGCGWFAVTEGPCSLPKMSCFPLPLIAFRCPFSLGHFE